MSEPQQQPGTPAQETTACQNAPGAPLTQRVKEHHEHKKNIFFQHFDRISLGGKLMAATIAVLLVGITVISFSLRTLVGNYMLEKTDTQLSQQSDLVFQNIDLLSKSDTSSGLSGPNSYFLQIQYTDGTTDSDGKPLVVTPLLPQLQDGIVSVPVLPTYGNTDGITLGKVFTAPAVARQIVEVQTNDSGTSANGGDDSGDAGGSNGTNAPDSSGGPATDPAPNGSSSSGSVTKILSSPKSNANRAAVSAASAPWRVVAKEWTAKTSNGGKVVRGVVYIGLSMSDQIDTLKTLTQYCIVVGIAVVLLGGSLSTLIIQRTLMPLKRMEKTAAKIAAGDLSQRIPSAPENTEVGSLAASLNTMLTRIEVSFHEQEETTEKMKRFVSDASHELRTPLAAIHGYAELYKMQRDMPGALERADESIEHIERSSQRMTVLVEDLLSLARLDEGRGIDVTGSVNLSSLVTDAVDDLHALDPDRVISRDRLELVPARDLSHPASLQTIDGDWDAVTLPGDASRLRQVVTNIVGNIHRYTPADSPAQVALGIMPAAIDPRQLAQMPTTEASMRRFVEAAEVGQSMRTGYRYAVLRFVDHGPGVPPESRSKIFERFYTADPSRARQKGGTGLGMAIAQSVVKAHHGFICATGTEGGGLTFTVILPVERMAATPLAQPAIAKSKEPKAKTSWFGGERKA
ncbi:sensor histidine kinase [Bifidobacterium cebidarum]|uniref:histidine kinase n=1 Tax=Bifidobacterium cebidarum TaxID=2650773 RepID=A0A6I1GHB6_9BIFI|nr:HAMP domain-containing sensor histidine kinase [Bifidobacterium cebidarum]KAB7789076.1 two-component system sensor histidine kinase [Bifidobacterium cebidarum]